MMYDEKPKRKKSTDYQQLRLRCPRCGRLNLATDIGCRFCGEDLFGAEVIRGTDYERFDPNDLRLSCLLAIIPGLGLLREGKWFSSILLLTVFGLLVVDLWLGFSLYETPFLTLSLLVALSIASVFVTFLVALDRMGIPRPNIQNKLVLLGRLVLGYGLIGSSLAFWCCFPFDILFAMWLAWWICKPFFGKGMD